MPRSAPNNSSKLHYLYVSCDDSLGRHIRVTSFVPDSVLTDMSTAPIAIPSGLPVHLRVEVDYERLRFAYRLEGGDWHWLPEQFDARQPADERGKTRLAEAQMDWPAITEI